MAYYQEVSCPNCGTDRVGKSGRSTKAVQRYRCQESNCATKTFIINKNTVISAIKKKRAA